MSTDDGQRGPALRKAILLGVVAALFVAGTVTQRAAGEPFDLGGLFLPVSVVLLLLTARPTFEAIERRRRPITAVVGVVVVILATVGLASGPGPFRLAAAVFILGVGLLLLAGAASPAVARRVPGLFQGTWY